MGSHGITSNTVERHVFGAGVWVRNYNKAAALSTQVANIIGATRGGNEITIVQEFKNVGEDIDGALGKIKGMTHRIKGTATGKMTLVDIDLDTLLDKLPGATVSEVGNVATITRSADVLAADYLTSVAWVGDPASAAGAVAFILKNPLSYEPLVFTPSKDDAAVMEVSFEAHYDDTDLATEPWEIIWPSNAVVS
ncbi:MAG: hypothetical protein WC415_06335 [Patescibacteria group bacterium]|jgi:hypothetical protein